MPNFSTSLDSCRNLTSSIIGYTWHVWSTSLLWIQLRNGAVAGFIYSIEPNRSVGIKGANGQVIKYVCIPLYNCPMECWGRTVDNANSTLWLLSKQDSGHHAENGPSWLEWNDRKNGFRNEYTLQPLNTIYSLGVKGKQAARDTPHDISLTWKLPFPKAASKSWRNERPIDIAPYQEEPRERNKRLNKSHHREMYCYGTVKEGRLMNTLNDRFKLSGWRKNLDCWKFGQGSGRKW